MEFIQLLANRLTVNRKWYAYLSCLPFTAYWVSVDKEIVRTLIMGDRFVVLIPLYGIIRYVVLLPPAAVVVGSSLSLHIQDFIVPYLACTARLRAVFYCLRQISAEISFKPV